METTNYFSECENLKQAQSQYRELLKKHHPDHIGGSTEKTIEIIEEFKNFSKKFFDDSKVKFDIDKTVFSDILEKIINLDINIEIIGFWIYCTNSIHHKDYLKELGFWFSGKHKAWIYSGSQKKRIKTRINPRERYNVDEVKKQKCLS
jgi:hypothetical protein